MESMENGKLRRNNGGNGKNGWKTGNGGPPKNGLCWAEIKSFINIVFF